MLTANLAVKLQGLLGANCVTAAEEALPSFAVDGISPAAIIQPASAAEVAEVVRFAASEKLAIVSCGSRSKLELGMPPARYDIALEMTGLCRIAQYDAGDLTLSVDAGMSLRQLERALADKQQFLPLAVPCFETSTVGGAVASGIDSVLRQQYGTARDFLIGAEFVDGSGRICKSGGRVVKNVTGYDLHKLLIGSLGTLCVITRLNFRTFPLAHASGGQLASFASVAGALAFRRGLETAGLPLSNLEVLSPGIAAILTAILHSGNSNVPQGLEQGLWCVYASYEGSAAVVERISRELGKGAHETNATNCEPLGKSTDESLGGMLREAFEWLRFASPAVLLLRLAMPEFSAEASVGLTDILKANSLRGAMLLRARGVIYFLAQDDTEEGAALDRMEKTAKDVIRLVAEKQGHATLLHAPLALKSRPSIWAGSDENTALMRRVKQAFDPQGLFAPGRFWGGL
jgi:glycolate dehydrogenase FAD-binding subunit